MAIPKRVSVSVTEKLGYDNSVSVWSEYELEPNDDPTQVAMECLQQLKSQFPWLNAIAERQIQYDKLGDVLQRAYYKVNMARKKYEDIKDFMAAAGLGRHLEDFPNYEESIPDGLPALTAAAEIVEEGDEDEDEDEF